MSDCSFDTDSPSNVSNDKQAVIAGSFLVFLVYNAAVALAYFKKDAEVSNKISRILPYYSLNLWLRRLPKFI